MSEIDILVIILIIIIIIIMSLFKEEYTVGNTNLP